MNTNTTTQFPTTELPAAAGPQIAAPSAAYSSPSAAYAGPYAAPLAQPPVKAPGLHAHGFAVASFVLGIASFVGGWTVVAPVVGLVLGILALRRHTTERTLALWGVWINGAILAFGSIALLFGLGIATFGLASGAFFGFGS